VADLEKLWNLTVTVCAWGTVAYWSFALLLRMAWSDERMKTYIERHKGRRFSRLTRFALTLPGIVLAGRALGWW